MYIQPRYEGTLCPNTNITIRMVTRIDEIDSRSRFAGFVAILVLDDATIVGETKTRRKKGRKKDERTNTRADQKEDSE